MTVVIMVVIVVMMAMMMMMMMVVVMVAMMVVVGSQYRWLHWFSKNRERGAASGGWQLAIVGADELQSICNSVSSNSIIDHNAYHRLEVWGLMPQHRLKS